jgi:hypothetical protein
MNKYKEGEIHFNLMGVVEDKIARYNRWMAASSVADPDPGSDALIDPGSGMRNGPGIRNKHFGSYFQELGNKYLGLK